MPELLADDIAAYIAGHTRQPSDLLQELERYTREHCELPQMLSGHVEGQFLRMLVRLTNSRRILEIGLFTGYSALAMAETLPDDGKLISCEREQKHADIARRFIERSPHGHKIEIRLGEAMETIRSLPRQDPFDMAFLDADKENYLKYYELVLPLLKNGGLLVADNVLWSGTVLNPQAETDHAIAAFNDYIVNDDRVEVVMLGVRDGVSLIRKQAE